MVVPFNQFNEEIIAALVSSRELIERKAILQNQTARMIDDGGYLLRLLPINFVFDDRDCAELGEVASLFVSAQTNIIRHLVNTLGRDGFLSMFRVPATMRRFINWNELLDPDYLVARFDILQSPDGYHFCEFNIDSCVAAAEIFDFANDYFQELSISVQDGSGIQSPLKNLGALVAETARRKNAARVVILDWSAAGGSAGKGYLSFERMREHVAREADPLPAFIADEKSYDPEWLIPEEAPRTLVHRGFMMEEMDDDGAFLDQLIALGTPVVNTYESEIRMNKIWFALFHDEKISPFLSAVERDLVAKYIPYTCELNAENLSFYIEHKNHYIFKQKQSFGGKGVLLGEKTSAGELKALLAGDGVCEWTAQKLIQVLPATFPDDESFRSAAQNLVFGMYLYGSRVNGMLVRASRHSKIVNVTAGDAKLAWAVCVNETTKAGIVTGLRKGNGVWKTSVPTRS